MVDGVEQVVAVRAVAALALADTGDGLLRAQTAAILPVVAFDDEAAGPDDAVGQQRACCIPTDRGFSRLEKARSSAASRQFAAIVYSCS